MIRLALLVGLILSGALVVQGRMLAGARADLQEARASLNGYRVADQFRKMQTALAQEAAALDRDLSEGVGADVPLSDYLRGAAVRVWP